MGLAGLRWHSHATQNGGGYTTYHSVLSFRTLDGQEVEAVTRNSSRRITPLPGPARADGAATGPAG